MAVPLMSPQVRITQLETEIRFLSRIKLSANPAQKEIYARLISLLTTRIESIKASQPPTSA